MFKPLANNPILSPQIDSLWQSKKVYNPGVIKLPDAYRMFYRAIGDDGISRIGMTISKDGLSWNNGVKPCLVPDSNFESAGVEDPRIIVINDIYLMTYTAYDGQTARLSMAKSDDLVNWQRFGPILPSWDRLSHRGFIVESDPAQIGSSDDWSKAGAVFNEKINGKYHLLFGDSCIWKAESQDGQNWSVNPDPILMPRSGFFDGYFVEMGPPPIKLPDGWLVIYHGVDHALVYSVGVAWLDEDLNLIKRSDEPVMRASVVNAGPLVDINFGADMKIQPRVIYTCGGLLVGDRVVLYYGMADAMIGVASAQLDDILSVLKNVL